MARNPQISAATREEARKVRQALDILENVEFAHFPIPGFYDSIPWFALETAAKLADAETPTEIAELTSRIETLN